MSAKTTMMAEDINVDFTSFYTPAAEAPKGAGGEERKEKDETRTGQILDCTNAHHLGTTFFCLIPDKVLTVVNPKEPGVPRLYRKVVRPLDGRIMQADSDKLHVSVQIPQAKDFQCKLSPSQKDIIEHLHQQGRRFIDLTSWDKRTLYPEVSQLVRLAAPPQIAFTYGKLIKFISATDGDVKGPEIGHVRVMKFGKGQIGKNDFITALNTAIKNKSDALGTSSWMANYFNRSLGEHNKVISLSVSQAQQAIKSYILSVTLEETKMFELTEEDLEVANNLNRRVFNIEEFDDEYYNKLALAFDRVQEVVDELGADRLSADSIDND